MTSYNHVMADFDLRPLQIRQHLIEAHKVMPNTARKPSFNREVWHDQHEYLHRTEDESKGSGVNFGGISEDCVRI
jgi:hypothetical protein